MTLDFQNIFEAIDSTQAAELQMRADLMLVIRDIIQEQQWTQTQAAEFMGLTQPRISDLVNGKIDKFSIDKLISCLYAIGFRIKPEYKKEKLSMAVSRIQPN